MCKTSGCMSLAWPSMLLLYWFKILMPWWTSNLNFSFYFLIFLYGWSILSCFVLTICKKSVIPFKEIIFLYLLNYKYHSYICLNDLHLICNCSVFRGFFHGYSFITVLMIINHALRYLSFPASSVYQ